MLQTRGGVGCAPPTAAVAHPHCPHSGVGPVSGDACLRLHIRYMRLNDEEAVDAHV